MLIKSEFWLKVGYLYRATCLERLARLRMRMANTAAHAHGQHCCAGARLIVAKYGSQSKTPNAGDEEAALPEVVQPKMLAQLLATVKSLQDTVGEQQREIEAQKDLVEKQREDTTKLHVNSYVHKTHQREMEMKAEMEKYSIPHIKR